MFWFCRIFFQSLKKIVIIAPVVIGLPSESMASSLEEGLEAYHRHDCYSALRLLLPLAQKNDPVAQNEMGLLYLEGCGVSQNYQRAFSWFSKAAEQGLPQAETSLGMLYAEGNGVRQSYTRAFEWFSYAADQNFPPAEYDLGMMYMEGLAVSKNVNRALKLFHRAALHHYEPALKLEKQLIDEGSGLDHDPFPRIYMWNKLG